MRNVGEQLTVLFSSYSIKSNRCYYCENIHTDFNLSFQDNSFCLFLETSIKDESDCVVQEPKVIMQPEFQYGIYQGRLLLYRY